MRLNRKLFGISFTFFLCTVCTLTAFANPASDLTGMVKMTAGKASAKVLTDGKLATKISGTPLTLSIDSETPMGGVYIKYASVPTSGLLDRQTPIADNGFLHEWIPLDGQTSASLAYESAEICEVQVYSAGELPKEVQRWELGKDETDLMLFATHSDDDQLFFAGLLPYYTVQDDVHVRVSYFIHHYDTYNRTHELLDGLWRCGVTSYPDISPFPDGYSESLEEARQVLASSGISYEEILAFQRSLLNKYRPKVAVLHDIAGEYSHGAHILNTASFLEVCETAGEKDYIPEKIYIHLYRENPILLDIDTPLEAWGGKSAFQVSQDAFRFHKSQHWTWFYDWLYGKNAPVTRAAQIRSYNPAKYGLYFSSVGNDTGNDMLENVETYAEKEVRLWQEVLQRVKVQAKSLSEKGTRLESEWAENFQQTNERIIRIQDRQTSCLQAVIAGCIGSICLTLGIVIYKKQLKHKRGDKN